ncbi:hypothetical protein ABID22_001630 [Pontibacter aydingkolensis]|uniref:TraB family protein n=1 Tax=Pontibacter aydingkolensis TaxID=1911536 RepID=A0ABS7CTX4_9BACT|nr:DUF5694 domain-containing protein [Pontibacter aydingkolensis]MBW7467297.1 hypothetical protein [Pontibacter aydingkolensis]
MKTTTTLQAIAAKLFILVAFILCMGGNLSAQNQIEIVIVASSHQNPGPAENYRYIVDKLKSYNPDMVFSEFLSPEELKQAISQNYYGAKADVKKRNFLLSKNTKTPANLSKEIAKAYASLNKFAYYHKTRMELARNLFLNYDKANAEYQFYVLEQHMQQKFGKSEQALFNKMFGGADSLRKVGLIRKNSEYQKIYFPLINELGHAKIYAADCQKYDGNWNKAWAKSDSLIKVMYAEAKSDTSSAAAQAVKAIQNYYKWAEQKSKEIDTETYGFMSTDLYAEYSDVVNFYGGTKFYDLPGYPKEAVQEMLYWWQKRNEGICENIIRQAQDKGAAKVVMAVGAAHRKGMEDIFAKMPNVKVVNYNDLP